MPRPSKIVNQSAKSRSAGKLQTINTLCSDLIMSLMKVIRFSSLAAQLTPSETISFITKAAKSNPQMIIDALSSYFMHRLPINDNIIHNDQCIESISNIIQSRDSQIEIQMCSKLDALPKNAIGACASFLDQKSYGRLSCVNRAVYLGCNSPNMLRDLFVNYRSPTDHRSPTDIQSLQLSKFPFANWLKLDAEHNKHHQSVLSIESMNIIASQIAKMPRLNSLNLLNIGSSEFIQIIANHESTNQRIKSLSAILFNRLGHKAGALSQFVSSITAFRHIEYLRLIIDDRPLSAEDKDMKVQQLIEMCSNLKGLDFDDSHLGIEMPVLQAIGHRLHCLTLQDIDNNASSALKNVNFGNLRQFQQGESCTLNSLRSVLKSAVNLEKVRLLDQDGLDVMEEILMKCDRLNYLELETDIGSSLDVVVHCLSRQQKLQRESFKIRIEGCPGDSWDAIEEDKAYSTRLCSIANLLSVNTVHQWMVVLRVWIDTEQDQQVIRCIYDDLRTALLPGIAHVYMPHDGHENTVLISNPGCTIGGWQETWLMNV